MAHTLPTQMVQHKDLSLSNNHSGVSFTFVSGTPNFKGLTSSDLFKFAIRTDDYKLFYLASIDPTVVWKEVPIPADLLGLGESSTTAYRGDRGKIAYDHSQVTHDKNLVGLGNVDNTADSQKPVSNATQLALVELDLEKVGFAGNSLSSLPAYANNAAAVSGGLSVGSLYRTNGDPDLVCIVH